MVRQVGVVSKLKEERFVLEIRKVLYSQGSEALEQVSQKICGCLIPGTVQGQVEWRALSNLI